MENEIPISQPPIPQQNMEQQEMVPPAYPDVEAMKAKARELAIQQFLVSKGMPAQVPTQPPEQLVAPSRPLPQPTPPKIIYLRRNLTVAELIVVFAISCGIVYGVPSLVKFAADRLPQIEIKMK